MEYIYTIKQKRIIVIVIYSYIKNNNDALIQNSEEKNTGNENLLHRILPK